MVWTRGQHRTRLPSADAWLWMALRTLQRWMRTNAALNSLLDLLEDRLTTWPQPTQSDGVGRTSG